MKSIALSMGVALVVSACYVQAGSLEIKWVEPQKFTDVRPSNENRARFRERVFKSLEEHLTELVSQLPEDYKLSMKVTNLDLAGHVFPSHFVGFGTPAAADIRVIRDVFIPRMTFSYQLLDGEGTALKSDEEVKLKDMDFRFGVTPLFRDEPFFYEKVMLEDWFDEELIPQFVSN